MRVFCCDFVLEIVETSAIDWIFLLALVRIIDTSKQRPERRVCLFADEPSRRVTAELENSRLESSESKFLAPLVGVDFAEDVLVTLWFSDCVSVGAVNLENWFDDLENLIFFNKSHKKIQLNSPRGSKCPLAYCSTPSCSFSADILCSFRASARL